MKRFTMIVALLLMVAMPMMAERVSPETARKVAQTFLNNNGAKSAQLTDLSKAAGFANLYIFNGEEGFVVMAADDCVQPILGYSLTGKFVAEGMPENVRWWLQGYSDQIADAVAAKAQASAEVARQWNDLIDDNTKAGKTTAVVGPLITTNWDQWYPYNYYCPPCSVYSSNGGHALTGCVATAMAQVLKYHNTPVQGIGSHSYTHETFGLQTANFGETNYDWDNMPAQIYTNSSPEKIQAVATLIYHCGVAVDMNYGRTSSGAYSNDIAPALKNYFNYSQSTQYVQRSVYENEAWIALMRTELDASRPVIYGGQDHPTNPTSGHSFVCDGYDSDSYSNDYFHFNWGWSGSYNSYFSIDDMTPGGDGAGAGSHIYSFMQDAVIGVKPSACQTSVPTGLSYTLEGRDVTLTWEATPNAASYSVYRNSTLIGSTSQGQTTYLDENAPYGTNTYYVRSGDSEGELSMPSNYVSATLSFPAPTGFAAQAGDDGVSLSWNQATGATAYNVYCNDILIGKNINSTSYIDNRTIAGTLGYYVKGVDQFGDESAASTIASVNVAYKTPIVDDLSTSLAEGGMSLNWSAPKWCYPQQPSSTLYYGNGDGNVYYVWSKVYYAHRYPASSLTQHANKKIYKVATKAQYAGTYTTYVYTNTVSDKPDPNALAATSTIVVDESHTGWREIVLDAPVALSGENDLWVVMIAENTGKDYPTPTFDLGSYNDNACYKGSRPTDLTPINSQYTISWFIKTYLTDGTYTYNLYQDGTSIAQNLSQTSYNATLRNNAANVFTVRTNYSGNETENSNKVGFTKGVASLGSLEMASNDKMTVTAGSELTVSETLTNTDPANLILENGAELVHNSANVKATVKKTITPPTNDDHGWYFIASPVTESITPSEENGFLNGTAESNTYDLYYYDEPDHKWMNHESSAFSLMPQKGYLYANEATNGTTLQFTGTLTPSNSSVTINGLSHIASSLNGFNLVGNPFACNATVNKDFYVVDNTTGKVILASNGSEIAPCAGIFVKATANDASVTFTKAASRVEPSSSSFDIVVKREAQPTRDGVATGSTTLDRARVRLSDAETLEKFSFGDGEGSVIYFPQDDQDLAVAFANGQNEMPLNFKAAKNGTYTLAFEVENLDLDYLHLIDNMTGNEIDVLAMPAYTFEAKTSDYASRFKLVFSEPTDGPSADDQPFAYYANGEIRIVADACDASLQVVDVTGRVIVSTDVARNVSTSGMPAGVYVLRLVSGDGVRTQKIVID